MRYPGPHGPLLLAESRITSMLQNISIADILQSTTTAADKQMLDERPGVHAVVKYAMKLIIESRESLRGYFC